MDASYLFYALGAVGNLSSLSLLIIGFSTERWLLVDQIINNWLHFTKRLLMKFHQAYTSNDRLPDQHLLHQNIYKFCPQVPALC